MSRTRRLLTAILAAGLTASTACLTAPAASAATACTPNNGVAGDLNSDGLADLVIGVPSFDNERGAVDILFSDGERRFLRATDLGLPSARGDRFGESVALGDVNGDGCADLAIGAPGRSNSKGAAYLVKGSHTNALTLMTSFAGTAAHGSFGAQLVLLMPQRQLVVSAPTADDGSKWEAGQVVVLPLTSGFALSGARKVITQNSPGVPGTSENGDRFGTALAGQGRTIVVGTPHEAVGTRKDAGSVTLLSATKSAPTTFKGVTVTQNSAGVPGTAETGDGFGSAVAFRDHYVLIGVPGETIGSARYAGQVHVLNFDPAKRTYRSLRAVHQNSAGIPGTNETGDYFGSSVALGINTVDQLTAIVGAPGEAIGTALGAGSVTMFRANRSGGVAKSVRQGASGIFGTPEPGEHFGWSVGVVSGDLSDGEAMRDGVVIGVPGEDIDTAQDAGTVTYSRNVSNWYTLLLEDTGADSVPAGAGYGETAATVAS